MSAGRTRTHFIDRLWRLLRIVFHTWQAAHRLNRVPNFNEPEGRKKVRLYSSKWSGHMLRILKVKLKIQGTPLTDEPCLFVANHQGFLDIPVIIDVVDAAFVAKAEVRNWPVFGPAAAAGGSVFVDRSSPESRKKVAGIIGDAIIQNRRSIAIFPEGTSSSHGKAWKKGSFAVAAEKGFRVQPIRIAYKPHRDCCYINKDHFLAKIWDLLGHDHIDADVEFLNPIKIVDVEKDSQVCEHAVQESLLKKLKEWNLRLETYDE